MRPLSGPPRQSLGMCVRVCVCVCVCTVYL